MKDTLYFNLSEVILLILLSMELVDLKLDLRQPLLADCEMPLLLLLILRMLSSRSFDEMRYVVIGKGR